MLRTRNHAFCAAHARLRPKATLQAPPAPHPPSTGSEQSQRDRERALRSAAHSPGPDEQPAPSCTRRYAACAWARRCGFVMTCQAAENTVNNGMRHRHATGAFAVAAAAVRGGGSAATAAAAAKRATSAVSAPDGGGQRAKGRQQRWQQQHQVARERQIEGVECEEFESAPAPAPSSTRRLLARRCYLPPTAHGGGRVWRMAGAILRASGGPRCPVERRDTVEAYR